MEIIATEVMEKTWNRVQGFISPPREKSDVDNSQGQLRVGWGQAQRWFEA